MPDLSLSSLTVGQTVHFTGLGYGCDMVLTDVGPMRLDHLSRPYRTASLVRADDAGHSLHLTIHDGTMRALSLVQAHVHARAA